MDNNNGKLQILRSIFGYDSFRPLQEDIIDTVLAGRDTLVVMPTGGGKSLCYQVPSLIFQGLTVVISPLISLMKDQVDQIKQHGISAILLNSSISRDEYREGMELVRKCAVRLLYVAPETILKNEILSLLSSVKVDCLAIDEAHCISEWGHDFRPEYRMIARVRSMIRPASCIALTATATERVRQDIRKNLDFGGTGEFIASFNRENLFYQVIPKKKPMEQTLEFLAGRRNESGIIYTFSRDNVDKITAILIKHGFSARPYHAGLPDAERKNNQELFIRDEIRIIVATIAFGMGINKTNVRFVLHFDLPKSIESYYQETGRAGRDGLRSECLLLYSYSDMHKIKYFIDQKPGEQEKQAALVQLSSMTAYADSSCCRRIPLMNYFGEKYEAVPCGMCDNCVTTDEETGDITPQALMFLSCIRSTGERFGAGHIIKVLRGSRSKTVTDHGHEKLAMYGAGSAYRRNSWQQMAEQFLKSGLVFQDMMNFGELKITGKGEKVLTGEEQVTGKISVMPRQRNSEAEKTYNSSLFELLRNWRKQLAGTENVPPYIIFSDRTLMEITEKVPGSIEQLMMIHGIGSHKLQKYGRDILEITAGFTRDLKNDSMLKGQSSNREYLNPPAYIRIAEIYNSGQSLKEIQEAEGIMLKTITGYLDRYVREGYALKSHGFINMLPADRELLRKVMDAFEKLGTEYLKPVFEELHGVIDYDTLRICRLYYMSCDRT